LLSGSKKDVDARDNPRIKYGDGHDAGEVIRFSSERALVAAGCRDIPVGVSMDAFEIKDRRFAAYILANAPVEELATGFRWLEGPVWFGDANCLLFQDLPRNRTMRWSEETGVSVFRYPTDYANGQTRDRQGRLVACSHRARCLYRTELDGEVTTLVSRHDGKRLNSPNDVVVKSDGSIWFTDPVYGLAFSPDERRLYVSETGDQSKENPRQYIRMFELSGDGARLSGGDIFHKIEPGYCDGLRVDEDGNLWSSAGDGVHCIDPRGQLIGKVLLPYRVSNLAFGGPTKNRLFILASHTLYAVFLNRRGVQWP
jgi:gluconolactonase